MRLARRFLASTGGRFVVILAVGIIGFQIWTAVQAPAKLDDDVGTAFDRRGRTSVEVELRFAPERYHILAIQEHGRISATEGSVVEVRGITMDGVHEIARYYWVKEIRQLDDPFLEEVDEADASLRPPPALAEAVP